MDFRALSDIEIAQLCKELHDIVQDRIDSGKYTEWNRFIEMIQTKHTHGRRWILNLLNLNRKMKPVSLINDRNS